MATVTKAFSFTNSTVPYTAEGGSWAVTDGNKTTGSIVSGAESTNDPSGSAFGLQESITGKNSSNSGNFWEWTGTWENLGVPAGATVTNVQLTSDWRVPTYTTGAAGQVGPAEYRDSAGTLLGTFMAGSAFSSANATWATRTGSTLSVAAGQQASNTTIKLRLNNNLATGNSNSANVILQQDYIRVTVTYTGIPTPVSATIGAVIEAPQGLVMTQAVRIEAGQGLAVSEPSPIDTARVVAASATLSSFEANQKLASMKSHTLDALRQLLTTTGLATVESLSAIQMPSAVRSILDDFTGAAGPDLNFATEAEASRLIQRDGSGRATSVTDINHGFDGGEWPSLYGADQSVFVTVAAISGTGPGPALTLLARGQVLSAGTQSSYMARISQGASTADWSIQNPPAGFILVGSTTPIQVGDTYELRCVGSEISFWRKRGGFWEPLGVTNNTSLIASGHVGLFLQSSTSSTISVDNFGVGAITTTPLLEVDILREVASTNVDPYESQSAANIITRTALLALEALQRRAVSGGFGGETDQEIVKSTSASADVSRSLAIPGSSEPMEGLKQVSATSVNKPFNLSTVDTFSVATADMCDTSNVDSVTTQHWRSLPATNDGDVSGGVLVVFTSSGPVGGQWKSLLPANQSAYATWSNVSGSLTLVVRGGFRDNSLGYAANITDTGSWTIKRNGVTLASGSTTAPSNGDVIELRADGSTITLYLTHSGTKSTLGSATNTANPNCGWATFTLTDTISAAGTGDNFGLGTSDGAVVVPQGDQIGLSSVYNVQGSGGTTEQLAMKFTAKSGTLNSLAIFARKVASPADNLVIAIQADSSGQPSGSDLATASLAGSSMTTSTSVSEIVDFGSSLALTDGTTYWVVFRRSGTRDTTNYYQIAGAASSSSYPLLNDAETGSSGTAVTTGNSGGANEDAFSAVTVGANMTLAYDSAQAAHGSQAFKVALSSTATAITFVSWTLDAARGRVYGAFYVYLTAFPASSIRIAHFKLGSTLAVGLYVASGTGRIGIRSAADSILIEGTVPVTRNGWNRIEFDVNVAGGAADAWLYTTADGTTAADHVAVTGQSFGASTVDTVQFGANTANFSSTSGAAFWLDDLNVNLTGVPGPGPYTKSAGGGGGTNALVSASGAWSANADLWIGAAIDNVYVGKPQVEATKKLAPTVVEQLDTTQPVSTTPVTQTALLPFEATKKLAPTIAAPADATKKLAVTAAEALSSLKRLAIVGGSGWLEGLQKVVQTLAAVSFEAVKGIAGTNQQVGDSLHTLAVTSAGSAESIQPLAIAGASDPVEAGVSIAASAVDPVESAKAIAVTASEANETTQGVSIPASAPLDAPQGLALPSGSDALDATGAVTGTTPELVDASQKIVIPSLEEIESIQMVSSTTTTAWEALQGLAALIAAPYESQAFAGVSQSAALALESLQAVTASGGAAVDALRGLLITNPPFVAELLQGIQKTLENAQLDGLGAYARTLSLLADSLQSIIQTMKDD